MRAVWLGLVLVACRGGGGQYSAPPVEFGGSTGAQLTGAAGDPVVNGGAPGAIDQAGQGSELPTPAAAGASEGGAGGDGGSAGQEIIYEMAGGAPMFEPGACDPSMKLGSDEAQSLSASDITLLAMTSDELSIAFTTGSIDKLALHVADRASAAAAFVEVKLKLPVGYEAASGVALSADASKLVLVMKDHSGFGQLERAKRGAAFGAKASTVPFAKINLLKPMSGHAVGWPVLSHDEKSLYFVSYFGQALVNQSARGQDGVFDFGTEIDEFTLGGNEGEYKLLSGISADERAIFYFDQASKHAMALFRSRPGGPFYDPLDLGDRRGVTPNADCSQLYSSAAGGLVVQSAVQTAQ